MRRQAPALAGVAATIALVVPAAAAGGAGPYAFRDPSGDANLAGLVPGGVPGANQDGQDIVRVQLRARRTGSRVTGIVVVLTMAAAPTTTPTTSYQLVARSSACGRLRMQARFDYEGAVTYADFERCGGSGGPLRGSPYYQFAARVVGRTVVMELPFKGLPAAFKAGTTLSGLHAEATNAEFVLAGTQPTDLDERTAVDQADDAGTWRIG